MFSKKIFYAFLLMFLPASFNVAYSQVFVTENGHAEFHSSVPLHTFTGESGYLTGMIDFEENLVDFYLDLETLETGNGRRDRDMYRTLNVEEYPFAEFTGALESPSSFDLNSGEKQAVRVSGEFTLHGITQEKTVEGTLQKQGNEVLLEAQWIQNITDHDIEPPGILFYRVDEEMEIRIEARLRLSDD